LPWYQAFAARVGKKFTRLWSPWKSAKLNTVETKVMPFSWTPASSSELDRPAARVVP